jgi:hypothetical protein
MQQSAWKDLARSEHRTDRRCRQRVNRPAHCYLAGLVETRRFVVSLDLQIKPNGRLVLDAPGMLDLLGFGDPAKSPSRLP